MPPRTLAIGTWTLLLAACAGGQTGEITELGACREPLGEVATDAASEAGAPAETQLARLTTTAEGTLAWADGADAALTVTLALAGEPATLVGGEGCERPFLHVPITVGLRTADGALDETLEGAIALQDHDRAAAHARLPLAALRGTLTLDGVDPETATLLVELDVSTDALGGQLFVRPSEAEDERRLATF